MRRFIISLIALFSGCMFPSCEGTMVPYTGHPALRIREISEKHASRKRQIALVSPITVRTGNGWELLNKNYVNISLQQELDRIPKGQIFVDREGSKSILTRASSKHLCAQHGYSVGINDQLPPNPNAKPTKHKRIITKTDNPKNELYFCGIINAIIKDPKSEIFEQIDMRGIDARAYYTPNNYGPDNPKYKGFVIGVAKNGEHAGRLLKAQPMTDKQLTKLRKFKIIND